MLILSDIETALHSNKVKHILFMHSVPQEGFALSIDFVSNVLVDFDCSCCKIGISGVHERVHIYIYIKKAEDSLIKKLRNSFVAFKIKNNLARFTKVNFVSI